MKDLKILVCGAGPVGIYFAGKLACTDAQITILETKNHMDQMKSFELHISSQIDRNFDFSPCFSSEPSALEPQDLILVCVKNYHTYDVGLKLLPVLKPSTLVISLQSALLNEKILQDILGPNMVMGCINQFNGEMIDKNTVEQHAAAYVTLGELDQLPSNREQWLSNVFSLADITHAISREINRERWKNFIWSCVFNTVCALCGCTLKQLHTSAQIQKTTKLMLMESIEIAKAEGIEITDEDLEQLIQPRSEFLNIKLSMLKDLEARKKTEMDSLTGTLLGIAKQHGINAPIIHSVSALLLLKINALD